MSNSEQQGHGREAKKGSAGGYRIARILKRLGPFSSRVRPLGCPCARCGAASVIRKNRSRVYFSMIERAPDVKGARYQPANSPWTRLLKEWTIGEDYHCYLKLLRSPWGTFVLSSTTFMR